MSSLTGRDIAAAGLADWTLLLGGLHTRLLTRDFATGLRLVNLIGAAAEAADHHPDLDLRYAHLDLRLTSHDVHAVTGRDLALARTISALSAAEGVVAAPQATRRLEIGLDTPDAEAVRPFWAAVLDMAERPADTNTANTANTADATDLHDDVLPALWFQESGTDEPRQRFHLDLWVSPDVVEERIAASLAAGGTLVSDTDAPAFWVLADAEGNQVCLCTWQDRDPS